VCVVGLWHLGLVTSAALADCGFRVCGFDRDSQRVANVTGGVLPLAEPGLDELIDRSCLSGCLRFSDSPAEAMADADVIWIAIDTPVDDGDRADVDAVFEMVAGIFGSFPAGILVIISSQMPIGSTREIASQYLKATGDVDADFVCFPENLRLGMAIERFVLPDRIVLGADSARAMERATAFLACIEAPIIEMSTAGAEATKHAINSFLATSIAFANEIGQVCHLSGVDPREVEAGLKSDERIGRRAYVRAGEAFAGGTLGRDLRYLEDYRDDFDGGLPLLESVSRSNSHYKLWPVRVIQALEQRAVIAGGGAKIVILGLTYKSSTNTLRRSTAVEIGQALAARGHSVTGYSPVELAETHDQGFRVALGDVGAVLRGADVAIVMTDAPEVATLAATDFVTLMRTPIVVDYGGFASELAGNESQVMVIDSEIFRADKE
jgi:UDPglucose 6-dehydrogenase